MIMKKKLLITAITLSLLTWAGYIFVLNTIVGMTKDFEPYTFEQVLGDSLLRVRYGITFQKSPSDYAYDNVAEVSYTSSLDKLQLSAWYVNSAPQSKKTIVLIHGRTSNRLKTMKYLQLFKETGIDTLYNFFIPDMRNSGRSTSASTYMGYKFAEDVHGALLFLKQKGQEEFILYGFSMGAMAISTMIDRGDLNTDKGSILKVIFDSPLADSKRTVQQNAMKMGLPNFIFENAYEKFSEPMDGYSDRMELGIQLKDIDIPILIIQSNDDVKTPTEFTKNQLKKLSGKSNIEAWFMDGPEHVRIYTDDKYRAEYTSRVDEFIRRAQVQ